MNDKPKITLTLLNRGRYYHLPDRDLLADIDKAEKVAERNLRRGHPLVPNAPAPVFPPHRDTRTFLLDNLLGRTVAWIKHQWQTTDHVTVHLFRPGPSDKQCKQFNKCLESEAGCVAKPGQKLTIKYIDPSDWGFGPKE
jgi:hypothetical protein